MFRYMMRDPKLWGKYGKLDEFDPGRFLPEINRGANELPGVSSIVFGFGRRSVNIYANHLD